MKQIFKMKKLVSYRNFSCVILLLASLDHNYAQLSEGSGNDANESFGESAPSPLNFSGTFNIWATNHKIIVSNHIFG